MRRSRICSAIAATALLGLSTTAGAGQLNYAAGAPASVPQYQSIEKYAQAVEDNSGGEYNLKIFAMTLLNFAEMSDGVRDGLFPSSPFQFNQDTWSSFSTEEREAMLKSAATGAAAILTQYREDMLTTRELMKDLGANFHEADGDVIAASEAFAKDDLKAAARSYAEKYDIQNGEQKLEDFRELLDKWRELVKGVETSEALADLLWSEVLSDVDVATYGVK